MDHNQNQVDSHLMEEDRVKCGKLKSQDIISYIRQTIDVIINLKEEEMLVGIYDEHKRQEKRKINHIRNFVEYRCKDRDEREKYAEEVLHNQEEQRQKLLQRIQSLNIATKEESDYQIPQAPKHKDEQLIKIEDDQQTPSPVHQGNILSRNSVILKYRPHQPIK